MKTDAPVILGEFQAGGVAAVDVPALIGSHCCVVANSGGGKSGLLRRLLEVTHGRVQQIVLDAEDEFFTLREKFAYVIAGGDGGDVPAQAHNAAGLALAALTHRFSLIVQLNELPDRAAFVGAFLAALVTAPKDLWHPVLIVIDEAQRFAPEGSAVDSSAGVRDLLERGRKRGFTALLASNRLAVIDKSVTGNVNNWLLGRVGQSRDRLAVADALGFSPGSAEARGLQGLPPRTFWSFGPALSPVPAQIRVGDVATTIIRSGQSGVPTPPAPAELQKILRDLATATAAPTALAESGRPESVSAVDRALHAELESYRVEWREMKEKLPLIVDAIHRADEARVSALASLEVVLEPFIGAVGPPDEESAERPTEPAPAVSAKQLRQPNAPRGDVKLSKMARAILAVLAAHYPRPRSKAQTALQAGYSAKSGSFRNALSELRTSLYLRDGDPLVINAEGVASAGSVKPMPTGAALVDFWCEHTGGMPATLLRILADPPRTPWAKDTLAGRAGYSATSGSFRNALSRLRTLGMITGSAELLAHEDLFTKGARR